MKRIPMAIAAAAAVLSGAAWAQVSPAYRTHGECSKAIAWANYDARKGASNPLGVLSPTAHCEKIGDWWYIVDGTAPADG